MRPLRLLISLFGVLIATTVMGQEVIALKEKGGLYAAYVVPSDRFERVDVQLIIHAGAYDDPDPSGTAHLTEHLAAFSADRTILRLPRERDVNAATYNVATVYKNAGSPSKIETLLHLSRAVLDRPDLPADFAASEIDIVTRETLMRERNYPFRWLRRTALQGLYGKSHGRASNTVADLPKLNLDAAFRFHETYYVPSNATLIVSGMVEPKAVAALVAEVFGDTQTSPPPPRPWLDHKPSPSLKAIKRIASDRLTHDVLVFTKFVEFKDRLTSIDMQGEFFIATNIINNRVNKALYFDDQRFLGVTIDTNFAPNADIQMVIELQVMPGVGLDAAHSKVQTVLATLLDDPITKEEIREARKREVVNAASAARLPSSFLYFLRNIAADGFPPITPTTFAQLIEETTDEAVLAFIETVIAPSATSVLLAQRLD